MVTTPAYTDYSKVCCSTGHQVPTQVSWSLALQMHQNMPWSGSSFITVLTHSKGFSKHSIQNPSALKTADSKQLLDCQAVHEVLRDTCRNNLCRPQETPPSWCYVWGSRCYLGVTEGGEVQVEGEGDCAVNLTKAAAHVLLEALHMNSQQMGAPAYMHSQQGRAPAHTRWQSHSP